MLLKVVKGGECRGYGKMSGGNVRVEMSGQKCTGKCPGYVQGNGLDPVEGDSFNCGLI